MSQEEQESNQGVGRHRREGARVHKVGTDRSSEGWGREGGVKKGRCVHFKIYIKVRYIYLKCMFP